VVAVVTRPVRVLVAAAVTFAAIILPVVVR
jgi:hypothetical protein